MNTWQNMRLVVLLFFVGTSVCSVANAEPKSKRSHSRILWNEERERIVFVTGSHIPQRVKLKSIGTTTPYNLRIYTKEELESTGRPGVHGLALDPSIQIRGGGF